MAKTIGIVGGGIIGLATAWRLQETFPGVKVWVFEKEAQPGMHQSGRNSGVLHCGLYYTPGSLKARLAVNGLRRMIEFCKTYDIPHEICGKVVVASDEREALALDALHERGTANGLQGLRYLSKEELKIREPYVWAHKALLVPEEGIVDYKAVLRKLQQLIEERGGEVRCSVQIDAVRERGDKVWISNGIEEWELDCLVACAGLHSDRFYQLATGKKSPVKIVPFRGEYMELSEQAKQMVNHLIYPVPDAKYPFLGVHFTRMINGSREVGPNAVLATKREGYSVKQVNLKDAWESLSYKGLWKFLGKNFVFSWGEFKSSIMPSLFVAKAQKLIPEIRPEDLKPGSAGVRAQAMDAQGNLIMDFRIENTGRQVHVLNAPSPGATASLAIADYIIDTWVKQII